MVCLSAALIDTEDEAAFGNDHLQNVREEPTRPATRIGQRWMGEYRQPRWMRRRWGGKNKRRTNKISKRLKRKQRRRMHAAPSDDFHYVDDGHGVLDQLDDFIPNVQFHQEEEDKMMDPQHIRIRIRLKQRGPVKRHAKKSKKSKKKSRKQKKKALAELAEKEAMTKVLKNFLNSRRRRGRLGRKGFKRRRGPSLLKLKSRSMQHLSDKAIQE